MAGDDYAFGPNSDDKGEGSGGSAEGSEAAGDIDEELIETTMTWNVDPETGLVPWLQALQAHQAEMRQYEYSPLVQINKKSVKKLVPVWNYSLSDNRGQEAQPLIYNGRMFVTASYSRLFAIDVKTGEELWRQRWLVQFGCTAADAIVDGDFVFLS